MPQIEGTTSGVRTQFSLLGDVDTETGPQSHDSDHPRRYSTYLSHSCTRSSNSVYSVFPTLIKRRKLTPFHFNLPPRPEPAQIMAAPSLQEKTKDLTQKIQELIVGFAQEDPLRTWFTVELDEIGIPEDANEMSLDEANARMHALKQLHYLVFQHNVHLKNPNVEMLDSENNASILTAEAAIPASVLEHARDMRFSIDPSLLHDPTEDNEQFDPISPTAKIVGYLRGMDRSLNLAKDSSLQQDGDQLLKQLEIIDEVTQASMAVLFQSRYRAINALIASSQTSQVVEFASGISPRGLQWSRTSPGTIYVESDLPHLMIHKAKLIRNTLMDETNEARGVLHCCAVDVLNQESVVESLNALDTEKPFSLVTEGLLLYFQENEMRTFLENISYVLKRFKHAVWITDFVTQQNLKELFMSDPAVARGVKDVFTLTGRSVVPNNPFEDEISVERHLTDYDLEIDKALPLTSTTPLLEFDIPLPQEKRDRVVGTRSIYRIQSRR